MLDKNGDGRISALEFMNSLDSGNSNIETWKKIIKEADVNGDGEIDLLEFTELLASKL